MTWSEITWNVKRLKTMEQKNERIRDGAERRPRRKRLGMQRGDGAEWRMAAEYTTVVLV